MSGDSLKQTSTLAEGGTTRGAAGAPGPVLDPGAGLGRYVVLEWIGSGGMGVIYAAYDPELDRKVALKIVRVEAFAPGEVETARRRLLREAQALARLAHPNVVTVHDAGVLGDQVFVAMEFVDGQDLKHWLEEERRPWRDIVEVFLQAGTGLQAAHRAGLSHRDFKPANVILGKDGRVRVLDFGLAVPHDPADDSGTGATETPAAGHQLTRTGHVAGTPAYMAPERYREDPRDGALSDQFSFCVALYEALYGEPPFAGATRAELVANQHAGRLGQPAEGGVPAFVRQAVTRGLEAEPERRHRSMEELLGALERQPRRRWKIAAGTATLAAGLLFFVLHRQPPEPCQGAELHLEGIWDAARKAEIEAAFTSSPKAYAGSLWRSTSAQIDRYAQGWTTMRTEACVATRLRGEQSEQLLDLRVDCLDRRLRELAALTDLLHEGTQETIDNALDATAELSPLDSCADARALTAVIPLPADDDVKRRAVALREQVARGKARLGLGHLDQADAAARSIESQVAKLDFPPAEAEALQLLGEIAHTRDDLPAASGRFLAAAAKADHGRHDEVRFQAAIELVWLFGNSQAERAAARGWLELAGGVLDRLSRPPAREVAWHQADAILHLREGDYAAAATAAEKAAELSRRHNGPLHRLTARSLSTLGNAQYRQERFDEAYETFRRVAEIRRQTLGPDHPELAYSQQALGVLLQKLGRYQEARDLLIEAHATLESALGGDHSRVAIVLDSLGNVYSRLGQYGPALDALQRGLAIWQQAEGENGSKIAASLNNIGIVLWNEGRFEEAEQHLRRAVARHQLVDGADHPETLIARVNLGALLFDAGRARDAASLLRPAHEIALRQLGEGHTTSLQAGLILGQARLALGDIDRGIRSVTAAGALIEREGAEDWLLGIAHFAAAQAALAAGDRDQARRRAELAADILAAMGPAGARRHRQLERWRAEHLPP